MKLIRTQGDYESAMARISELIDMSPELNTPESDELDVLALLVEHFERKTTEPVSVDPVEAILFRMDQAGHTRDDLAQILGSNARVTEIITGKRRLSRQMVLRLNQEWGIPIVSLMSEEHCKPNPTVVRPRISAWVKRDDPWRKSTETVKIVLEHCNIKSAIQGAYKPWGKAAGAA